MMSRTAGSRPSLYWRSRLGDLLVFSRADRADPSEGRGPVDLATSDAPAGQLARVRKADDAFHRHAFGPLRCQRHAQQPDPNVPAPSDT